MPPRLMPLPLIRRHCYAEAGYCRHAGDAGADTPLQHIADICRIRCRRFTPQSMAAIGRHDADIAAAS